MRNTLHIKRRDRALGSASHVPPSAFTLVELLVVIAIIGVLVALLLPAINAARIAAAQKRVLTEINQFDAALKDYKNERGGFPPNAQTDAGAATPHLDNDNVLADFKRHLKQAFPSHREPNYLVEALVGKAHSSSNNTNLPSGPLAGGMNAAEALVFWLGGFSDDPKYPISGIGGPSYSLANLNGASANQADPIDNRSWLLDVKIQSLGPRDEDGFYDESDDRFVEYQDPQDPNNTRRINFWYLKAPDSTAPYLYFDASRASSAEGANDTPAATAPTQFVGPEATALNQLFMVHAIKRLKSDASADKPYQYANDGQFQILHCGRDDEWGVFPLVSPNNATELLASPGGALLELYYPDGPWVLELSDTLTNIATSTLEDAQP